MNRTRTNAFQIDGRPMPAPDRDMDASFEDIDAPDSGRTLDGVMHRAVLRFDVAKWPFVYGILSTDDYNYLQSLFRGKKNLSLPTQHREGLRRLQLTGQSGESRYETTQRENTGIINLTLLNVRKEEKPCSINLSNQTEQSLTAARFPLFRLPDV